MHEQLVVWTCDRCGKKESVAPGKAPSGWRTVESSMVEGEMAVPPGDDNSPTEWEVCRPCYNQLVRFLTNHETQADAPAAAVA